MNRNLLLIILGIFSILNASALNPEHVDSKTFSELIKTGNGIVLDVRTSKEYAQGHIENSTLISTNDPGFVEKVNLLQRNKPIYVYCLSGSRSNAVANYLSNNGFSQIYNLRRGLLEWRQYGYNLTASSIATQSNEKTYSTEDFNSLINTNELVLIDFHAPWCAPCKKMAPTVEKLQMNYADKAKIEKIDIQSNKLLQSTYKVETIPGFILFKEGKQVWTHTGLISYEELSSILNKHL